ncbi:hypothetical protein ACFL3A_09895 [Pseudomonadota bacterium]
MDRIIFGDNQFFGVDHMSEARAREKMAKFKDTREIINVLDAAYDIGIRTFMCTTYDRLWEIGDHFRANQQRYHDYKFYPCMPYAHKYANSVSDLGILGTLKLYTGGNIAGTLAKGGMALAKRDMISIMKLLVDSEMKMFHDLNTPVVFLQNVVTDLLLGLGMTQFLAEFSDYIQKKYNAEAGFITMNLPLLVNKLEEEGLDNPIVCSSINKIGFRMSGGKEVYEKTLKEKRFRSVAMQVLAAGGVRPTEAIEYVAKLQGVRSIVFGASTPSHIKETKDLIVKYSD